MKFGISSILVAIVSALSLATPSSVFVLAASFTTTRPSSPLGAARTPRRPFGIGRSATRHAPNTREQRGTAFFNAGDDVTAATEVNDPKNLRWLRRQNRGGSCEDTDTLLFVKVGVTAAVQSAALLSILLLPSFVLRSSPKISILNRILSFFTTSLKGISVLQWTAFTIVVFLSSLVGSLIEGATSAASAQALAINVTPGDPEWYTNLKRPSWEPPAFVFPIMWLIVVKPTQLVALATLFRNEATTKLIGGLLSSNTIGSGGRVLVALAAYSIHRALGDAWNKVFFMYQCPGRGAAVISTFLGMLWTTAYLFFKIDPRAGLWMLPSCGWVAVATALNWNIYLNNPTCSQSAE